MTLPLFRPVAEQALLVEFSSTPGPEALAQVRQLDRALAAIGFAGFLESVPAFVNLLVRFDPCVTDHQRAEQALTQLISGQTAKVGTPAEWVVEVCYEAEYAPDLAEVARVSGLSAEAVIAAHLAGDYAVVMYGFAPGYAYLTGVPEALHLPRKPSAVRNVPAGSVIIAGAQCLVTTLTMPTGWWIIGRSPTAILRDDPARPFLFDTGDAVRFRRVGPAALGGAA